MKFCMYKKPIQKYKIKTRFQIKQKQQQQQISLFCMEIGFNSACAASACVRKYKQ